MIRHHPSDPILLAMAAGHLPVPHQHVLRAHLARCPQCRAMVGLGEAIGGALLQALPPAPMADDALARSLARLDTPAVQAEQSATPPATTPAGRWWWFGPGLRLRPLLPRGDDGARLDLLRVKPGASLPGHGHEGCELTCVLQGAFSDGVAEYHAGDLAEGETTLQHAPVALDIGQDCVCLVATTGRVLAHGRMARLLQRLTGW